MIELLAVLEKEQPVSGATLRAFGILDLLEKQNSPNARALLEVLARGAPEAWVTEEAKASLRRRE
jgi:hypothetical protein